MGRAPNAPNALAAAAEQSAVQSRKQTNGGRAPLLGLKFRGSVPRVQGLGFRVQGLGYRAQGSGVGVFRVSGFRVQFLGFRV